MVTLDFQTTALAATPGSTLWMAAHLKIAPGFRIFWINPGDVGRPTQVEFSVPDGFEVSESRYPPPTKFELADGGVSYGYEGEAAAFARVRIAPDLDPKRMLRFEVDASWLACSERCYPESTTAFIEFGVSDSAEPTEFAPALARLQQALPRPLDELTGVSYRWKRGGHLSVSAAKTEWLDFLPARPTDPKLVEIGTNAKKSELKLRFEDGTPGSRVTGLAVADGGDGGNKYVSVDIPWPVKDR